MNTESHYIEVSDLEVEVVRKPIKNLHLAVYPPAGRVRVAVPMHVDDEAVRLAVVSKLGWIRRKQSDFARQMRQSEREMIRGESHYFMGQRYRLEVIEEDEKPIVRIKNNSMLQLQVRPGTSAEKRRSILDEWYRSELKAMVPELITKWEPVVRVDVAEWGIRRMKTRWGTCNIAERRIWLNLELAKKPPQCLEYILVHEMVHLLERHHNDRFRELMDRFMPQWRLYREALNREPLAHEGWGY